MKREGRGWKKRGICQTRQTTGTGEDRLPQVIKQKHSLTLGRKWRNSNDKKFIEKEVVYE